ncbi:hypothetical protein C2I06_09510 [Niallia circulans]|uniref:hypothetical protein n=1 Tax=Niallia circulans TaxID=1397 RepID=UPI000F4496EE|nr:hypothetical protein [Niallia circulans]AYV67093.1 hypothetical protein C2I06_09510 [Niallia circulans]
MKILKIQINCIVSEEQKEKIKKDIEKQVASGVLVHDSTVNVEVIEFDDTEVKFKGDDGVWRKDLGKF